MSGVAKYRLYLSGGQTVVVQCPDDEVDSNSESFIAKRGEMNYDNGCFRAEYVIGMEYLK